MKKRLLAFGLIAAILMCCTSCKAVRDVFQQDDPSSYLMQEADQMLTAMHNRFSPYFLSLYSSNPELQNLLQQATTAVTTVSQAKTAEWMVFDSYENATEYSYRNGGVFYTAGLPGEMIQSVFNAYGAAYVTAGSILVYQEFISCPKSLAGKRAAIMLDYGNACAVCSFTSESAGLLCTCQWVPLAQDGNLTFSNLSNRVASGSATRTTYSSTEIASLLSSEASVSLVTPEKNTSDYQAFLQSSSLEMVDYMRVCNSSSLLSLKAPASDYDDFFSEMDQAYAGTQRTSTIYTGLNQASIVSLDDGLEPYLAETGQSLETVFGRISLSLIVNILNQSGFLHQCFTVVSLSTIYRYAVAPENFEPAMVLIQCSERVGVLVTYYENHGVVIMTGNAIVLPEGSNLSSVRDALAEYFVTVQ